MKVLIHSWRITNRCIQWWGIFLLILLFISAIALLAGVLTLDANLDLVIIDEVTNPMFVLMLLALLLFIVVYPIVFVLVLPIALLKSYKSESSESESLQAYGDS